MRAALPRLALHAAVVVVALGAGWTASAAALPTLPPPPITLPTLTLPTVTVPPVTTPVVTTPAVTTPAVTTPAVTTPVVRTPPAPVQAQGTPLPDLQPPPPPSRGDSGHRGVTPNADETGQGRAETSREQASRLRLARDRGSGPRGRTLIVIALPRRGLIELALREVAPDCRLVGRYRVRGHRGRNRLRLRRLRPGTYVAEARSVPRGRLVARKKLVVSDRNGRMRTSREADACRAGTSLGSVSSLGQPQPPAGALSKATASKKPAHPARRRGVLGAKFGRKLLSGADSVPIWVYGLLALGVGLLAAGAALPKGEARSLSASLMAGSAGAAILLGLTIVYALG